MKQKLFLHVLIFVLFNNIMKNAFWHFQEDLKITLWDVKPFQNLKRFARSSANNMKKEKDVIFDPVVQISFDKTNKKPKVFGLRTYQNIPKISFMNPEK